MARAYRPLERLKSVGAAALALSLTLAACALAACSPAPHRAAVPALHARAAYDLGCQQELIQLYQFDGRTRAAVGCGRRLTYVEHCEPALGRAGCTWVIDTATYEQTVWPQRLEALGPRSGNAGAAAPAAAAATCPQKTCDCIEGRAIRTELYDTDRPIDPYLEDR